MDRADWQTVLQIVGTVAAVTGVILQGIALWNRRRDEDDDEEDDEPGGRHRR